MTKNVGAAALVAWVLGMAVCLGSVLGVLAKIRGKLMRSAQLLSTGVNGDGKRKQAAAAVDEFDNFEWNAQSAVEALAGLREERAAQDSRLAEGERMLDAAMAESRRCSEGVDATRQLDFTNASQTLEGVLQGLQAASANLQAVTGEVNAGMEEQQRAVSSAATAMEQMNASIAEVAMNTEAVAQEAQSSKEFAMGGAAEVERTIESIGAVKEKTGALSEVLTELGSQAEAINKIMTVISDIADQTNLLALNAAIEAARAGEAGRGFAVVADEVRKLAEKTMDATRDVGGQIKAIQGGVQRSLETMDQSLSLVDEAAERSGNAGEAMRDIVARAEQTSSQIESIAAATRQQSAASEDVNRVTVEVNDISSRTAAGMGRSGEAVQQLGAQVGELSIMRQVFDLIGRGAVQQAVNALADSAHMRSMDRDRQEGALRDAIRANTFLELLYVTDDKGRQVVANVPAPGMETPNDANAFGTDWSSREWFIEPMRIRNLYITKAYVSSASGENCITVSRPFYDETGRTLGVLAADVKL